MKKPCVENFGFFEVERNVNFRVRDQRQRERDFKLEIPIQIFQNTFSLYLRSRVYEFEGVNKDFK